MAGQTPPWWDLTWWFEARLQDLPPNGQWGPWLPVGELLPGSEHDRVSEVEFHSGSLTELAEEETDVCLDPLVEQMHDAYGLTHGSFEIRVRIDQGATHLTTVEVSPERLTEPLLRATCAAINRLQHSARHLAGAAQRAGVSTEKITKALTRYLSSAEPEALLAAHRTADEVNALLLDYQPRQALLYIGAHTDGSTRISLGATYEDQCAAQEAAHGGDDAIPFDHDARYETDLRDAETLVAMLEGHFAVTMSDGQPATPCSLVLGSLAYGTALISHSSGA
ncbi:hypothetical protein ACIRPK_36210 [Kitasatospora sp. NPDC101801]|uniref:hypothetical protein n=1 Tax=Kitasatospora sp. NPDC101801 TaxID=3364103 RepID=UPI0038082E84